MTDDQIRRAEAWAADEDAERHYQQMVEDDAEVDRLAARVLCPDCHGTTLNRLNPANGGSCPSCFGGYLKG